MVEAFVANVGYCYPNAPGWQMLVRAFRQVASYRIPQPVAFFPLTGGSLSSATLPTLKGRSAGVNWVPDSTFGFVLECSKVARWPMFLVIYLV